MRIINFSDQKSEDWTEEFKSKVLTVVQGENEVVDIEKPTISTEDESTTVEQSIRNFRDKVIDDNKESEFCLFVDNGPTIVDLWLVRLFSQKDIKIFCPVGDKIFQYNYWV